MNIPLSSVLFVPVPLGAAIPTAVAVNDAVGYVAVSSNIFRRAWGTVVVFNFQTLADISNISLWLGLGSLTLNQNSDPGGHIAAFRYHAVDDATAFFRTVTRDGTTINAQATTLPIAINTNYTLRLELGASDVKFYSTVAGVDTLLNTHNTNLPGLSTNMFPYPKLIALAASARSFKLGEIAFLWD